MISFITLFYENIAVSLKKIKKKILVFFGLDNQIITFCIFGIFNNIILFFCSTCFLFFENPFIIYVSKQPYNFKYFFFILITVFSTFFFSKLLKKKGIIFQKKLLLKYDIIPSILLFFSKTELFLTKNFKKSVFLAFLTPFFFLITFYREWHTLIFIKIIGLFLRYLIFNFYFLFRVLFDFKIFRVKKEHSIKLYNYSRIYRILQKKELLLNRDILLLTFFCNGSFFKKMACFF